MEDIKPYVTGFNVLECVDTNPAGQPTDVFIGEVSMINCAGTDVITTLTIRMSWIVRIREPIDANNWADFESFEPLPDSKQLDYDLQFDNPQLSQKRSPLIFRSGPEIVKISHVTKLAKVALNIKGTYIH